MPPARMRGDGRMAKDPKKTFFRLLSYLKRYWAVLAVVMVCILIHAFAQIRGSTALGDLVDDYILPMVANGSTDFGPVIQFGIKIACIFVVGIVANFLQSYLMVGVTQGAQKYIRDQLFAKMQTLPIRYFDTHPAGDLMSRYTSDIDTMRQMISQSIPQTASALVTLVAVFIAMVMESWILTVVTMITVVGIVWITKYLAGKAGKYFIGQQKSLGAVNG